MVNEEHLKILKQGVEVWNHWRKETPGLDTDLSSADLSGMDLSEANLNKTNLFRAQLVGADLRRADLSEAELTAADLTKANLSGANLRGVMLIEARLSYADLSGADLSEAFLSLANIYKADLSSAILNGTQLLGTTLIESNLEGATIAGCAVYGISVWNNNFNKAKQSSLIITEGEHKITVDSLELAQFIHLLLNNQKVRDAIDTITSKAVLILGRFTPERKAVLDAVGDELRKRNYLPIIFDFEKPGSRNFTETVSTLAHMARFVIADISDAKSIPQELERIIPDLPSLPVQPLLLSSQHEYGMFQDFYDYPWVLKPCLYDNLEGLLTSMDEVITPAEAKAKEIGERRKAFEIELSK